MASGAKSFVYQYRAGKRSRRMTLQAATAKAARAQAIALKGQIVAGRLLGKPADPLAERRRVEAVETGKGTFKAIAKEWLKREGHKTRAGTRRLAELERLAFPVIGNMQVAEIKRSDIIRLLDGIEDENGPGMADYILRTVRRVMSWHEARDDDFVSPIRRGMARTKVSERKRSRILDDDELRALEHVAKADTGLYGPLLRFILRTGVRREEALGMRRNEIVDDVWTIPKERYKTNTDHVVPLSPAAKAIIHELPRFGDLIFTTSGRGALGGMSIRKRRFDRLMLAELRRVGMERNDKALLARVDKVEDLIHRCDQAKGKARKQMADQLETLWFTVHDLRRTARSRMSAAGVDPDIAERCLGHKIGGERETYDRYGYLPEKRAAFEALACLIERIVNPADNVIPMQRQAVTG